MLWREPKMLLLVPLEDGTRRVVCLSQGCLLKLATGESLAGGGNTVTESKPEAMTAAAEADASSLGSAEDSGKGSSTSEEEDGNVAKPTAAAGEAVPETGGQELVFIQDTGFNVRIQAPGIETFDIQVSSMELVQEIHQLLMDREDTCHRTCFSLQLDGTTLDNFAELKNIQGLTEGSLIKVVEEPYTVREARIHVRHVRDLLKSLDPGDAYNGLDCSSLAFLNVVTQGDILEKKSRGESVDCTPPDYIIPGCKENPPLVPLLPQAKDQKSYQALKVLTTSGWNPPPGPRKLHGDLMYLYVVTLEDKRYHITASTRGFYVNESTEEEFNPRPCSPKHVYHSLVDLLSQVSSSFKRNFALIQKKRTQRHPFERVATPYQVYSWLAPTSEHSIDAIRAEDAFSFKLGYEEHIPGQTRDWNDELQTTRELPRKTLPERLLRERAVFKVHSDFVAAATRGAVAVVDGNVMAINPGEETKMQMFIWNNIFFSLGFDVRDHYKELGGDAAAFVAPCNDLQGVRAYAAVDVDGLCTLGTVVVDYRGYRVTAQSIIPGILEREQDQSVVYGSVDFGKTVVTHPDYLELLKKAGNALKILPHSVINEKSEEVELCSSVECKGITGNDNRHYILDLLRTFPPDVNYLILDGVELCKESRAAGFPREHKHKLCCLRQELIDAFVEARYVLFMKLAAFHLRSLEKKQLAKDGEEAKKEDSKEGSPEMDTENKEKSEPPLMPGEIRKSAERLTNGDSPGTNGALPDAESQKDVIVKAARGVGSLKDTEFDIRFNPDVFSPGVKHAGDEEQLKRQRRLVIEAADFLVADQLPAFVKDCADHSCSPIDGITLSEAMHSRGINMRYLGRLADMLAPMEQLKYLHAVVVGELLTRAAKHLLTTHLQGVDPTNMAAAISHFLNCFLAAPTANVQAPVSSDELKGNRKKGKRKGRHNLFSVQDSSEWASLTPRSLWEQLRGELRSYYGWELPSTAASAGGCPDEYLGSLRLLKCSLLRSICLKTGLQLLHREYALDNRARAPFTEDDILQVFPVAKHVHPRATDAYHFYLTGQSKIQQGLLREGYELVSEALNLMNNVYGALHPEIAQCLRLLARLCYVMGDHLEAMAYQQKAVLMSERVNGIDHPYTITEYTHLALYCFANSQVTTTLKLLYRARYLMLLACGENHPEMPVLDSNIGLILHAVGEYDLSLRFLENALKLNIAFYGSRSLKVAVSYHLVARAQSCLGEFRSALQNEKETYTIYKAQLGEEHDKTRESSECLRHLTQQAVVLQKKINDIYKKNTTAALPPIQIQAPSQSNVLEMLNIINGILFVQISPQDIENFKAELERRQQLAAAEKKSATPDEGAAAKEPSDACNGGAVAQSGSALTNGSSPVNATTTTTETSSSGDATVAAEVPSR
ncbi:clustered mitochondria protein homolog isoform X1 [Dermacentor andersoni]|uniref:clustered mitochondria protein homolog isoform X1 n=1 Tax=Dermacentor andersoni TaxID=34620 RepID=UPI0021552C0A|nr:clustered mitochondria protein homolog isoform X1 [Dermacentor andersoni]